MTAADDPAERVRAIADTIGTFMGEALFAELYAIADATDAALAEAAVKVPPPRQCAAGARRSPETCDRPDGHAGRHSWEADVLAARAAGLRDQAEQIPGLRQRVKNLERYAEQLDGEVASQRLEMEAMRRPRRRGPVHARG